MLKFKVTPERFAEATNVLEFLAITGKGNLDVAYRLVPRFLLEESGEYMVKVVLDSEGDIAQFKNLNEAMFKMSAVTPKRLEQLKNELMEAANSIVNPPSVGA